MTRLRPLTASERRLTLLVGAVAVLCGLLLCWRARENALGELALARADHKAVVSQARRLIALSGERAVAADRPRAQPDLVARLHACLRNAGVDPARLTQVSASEPRPASGSGIAPGSSSTNSSAQGRSAAVTLMRQETGITIDQVRPADLVRFLAGWREAEPLWIVRVVSLQRSPGAPEREDRYTALLTLETLFTEGRERRTGASAPDQTSGDGSAATLPVALKEPSR